jgi:YD repeat-containing protein
MNIAKIGTAVLMFLCLAQISPSSAAAIMYTYDTLGRVVQVTYSNGRVITYTYDAAGNRQTYTVTAP